MLLTQKEAEILKLKRAAKERGKGKMADISSDKTGGSLSAACLDNNDKAVIARLRQEVKELNDIIALQSHSEQSLTKQLQYLKTNRTKEDINYEYIKNIFIKYLIFQDQNAGEANRMKEILLDMLKVTKQEKEALNRAKESKGFWKIFYGDSGKEEALADLNSSFVIRSTQKLLAQIDRAENSTNENSDPSEDKKEPEG